MTGRVIKRGAHQIEGEVAVGRTVGPAAKLGTELSKAHKRDKKQIENLKQGVRSGEQVGQV